MVHCCSRGALPVLSDATRSFASKRRELLRKLIAYPIETLYLRNSGR